LKSESSKRGSEAEEARSDRPPMLLKVNREKHTSPVEMADHQVKGNVMHDESGNQIKEVGNNGFNEDV
jgi:hypothetical protein